LKGTARVPIDELKQLPEFTLLPLTYQNFLAAYIESGYDARAAVLASYPNVKVPDSARRMGERILHSPGITMLLHLHFGDDPKDAFCRMVAKAIITGKLTKEQLEAMKLIADVREFRQPWTPRYEKRIIEGMANNEEAVKRRVQRAAKTAAVRKIADQMAAQPLMPDFQNL